MKMTVAGFRMVFRQSAWSTCCSRWKSTSSELENRQKEMMARSLPKKQAIAGVKQIFLVASGKGGVGKSTVAVNLATALKVLQPHKEVGLLDTDIFGPSIPLMMNLHEAPIVTKGNLLRPLVNYGINCMSMGFLVDDKSPVIWRGLMVMSGIEKLLRQVHWESLDYLIVDTPPGTGDTQLSLIQNVPIAGVLLVTTSQLVALQVTKRGAVMFQKLNIPICGIVQNMSSVTCQKCDHTMSLFGNGTRNMAHELGVELLQDIPLDVKITECADAGRPVVISHPKSSQAAAFLELAEKVSAFLTGQTISSE